MDKYDKKTRKGFGAHSVEAVVDEMLQVFAHSNLSHQLVLVAVHSCKRNSNMNAQHLNILRHMALVQQLTSELADVREDVLQSVRELERVDVSKTILHVTVDDQLGQSQDLATQVEGVPEARLLSLLLNTRRRTC